MRRTQLKKEPDRMKIAPKQCISWKTCGGVEEFCANCETGDTLELINMHLFTEDERSAAI